jgi:nitrile hydratase
MAGDHHHGSVLSEMDLRVRALETLLVDKGYVDTAALDALVETLRAECAGPQSGSATGAAPAGKEPAR